jgi:hypothetical protein
MFLLLDERVVQGIKILFSFCYHIPKILSASIWFMSLPFLKIMLTS